MNRIKSIILSAAIAATSMAGGFAPQAHALGNASLSMSGGSHQAGTSFAVPVYVNSGADPVNVIQADWTYNASALQFQGVSCGGSFGITAGTGANTVTCGVAGGASVTGSQLVAVINFKALAGSGSSVISIAPSSHVYRSTDNADVWNGVPTSTGVSFSAAAPVVRRTTPTATPSTEAAATPAPAAVTKKAPAKVHKSAALSTKPAAKHSHAWLYSLLVLAALAGATYFFRQTIKKYSAPWANKTRKNFRLASKRLRKTSLVKAFQRS